MFKDRSENPLRLNGELLKNLSEKDKKLLTSEYNSAILLVNQLDKVLTRKLKRSISVTIKDFSSSSWPFRRAFQDGYAAGLEEARQLLRSNKYTLEDPND